MFAVTVTVSALLFQIITISSTYLKLLYLKFLFDWFSGKVDKSTYKGNFLLRPPCIMNKRTSCVIEIVWKSMQLYYLFIICCFHLLSVSIVYFPEKDPVSKNKFQCEHHFFYENECGVSSILHDQSFCFKRYTFPFI